MVIEVGGSRDHWRDCSARWGDESRESSHVPASGVHTLDVTSELAPGGAPPSGRFPTSDSDVEFRVRARVGVSLWLQLLYGSRLASGFRKRMRHPKDITHMQSFKGLGLRVRVGVGVSLWSQLIKGPRLATGF